MQELNATGGLVNGPMYMVASTRYDEVVTLTRAGSSRVLHAASPTSRYVCRSVFRQLQTIMA